MSVYRSNASSLRADTLEQLFGARLNLRADEDGLALSYRLMPWKRHVSTVRFTPSSLAERLAELARTRKVTLDVLRSDRLTGGRYRVDRLYGEPRLLRGTLPSDDAREESLPLELVADVRAAHVRVDWVRFALGDGELRFEVSSYEPDELAPRFRQAYPWERLELPALTGREWQVLGAPIT